MSLIYNMSELTEQTNLAEWVLTLNSWTNNLLFMGFCIVMVLVLFGIMITANVDVLNAFTAANFLGLFIAWLMWLLGQVYLINSLPILFPILFTTFAAIGAILIYIRDAI